MPPTADELTVARSWIGTTETDAVFNERFDRIYALVINPNDTARRERALNLAIEESLRAQLAVLTLDQPASMSAEGNSVNYQQNIISLQQNLTRFTDTKGSMTASVGKLHRVGGR